MMRTNFIAKIEKLYINLAVSRKVFDNYKQKILDYELQKVKISHQYTDYINGLKLDVYAHMAG